VLITKFFAGFGRTIYSTLCRRGLIDFIMFSYVFALISLPILLVYASGCEVPAPCKTCCSWVYFTSDDHAFFSSDPLVDGFFISGFRYLLNSAEFNMATIREKRHMLAMYAGILNTEARIGRVSWYGVLPGLLSESRMTAEQFTTMLDLFRLFVDSSAFENHAALDATKFRCTIAIRWYKLGWIKRGTCIADILHQFELFSRRIVEADRRSTYCIVDVPNPLQSDSAKLLSRCL